MYKYLITWMVGDDIRNMTVSSIESTLEWMESLNQTSEVHDIQVFELTEMFVNMGGLHYK